MENLVQQANNIQPSPLIGKPNLGWKYEQQANNIQPGSTAGKRKPRVSCVILNYNDASTVEKLVRKIYAYPVFHSLLLVDNCSTDDSLEQLRKLAEESEKIMVLSTSHNGGYGMGNNVGIRYAYRELQADYVLIANPDVDFSENLVLRLLRLFERHPVLGAASASMQDPVFGKQRNGWPLFGFWRELARCGPVCRRVFKPFLEYSENYFRGKKAVYVDALHGSLLMVDARKMMDFGGYDEGLFLYQEEAVLGCRMRNAGCRSALLLTDSYNHLHSASISRTYQDVWERQKLRNKSCMYYYRHYLAINRLQEMAAKIFFQIVHLEIWFCSRVLRMRW